MSFRAVTVALLACALHPALAQSPDCPSGYTHAFADLDVADARVRVFSNGAIAWNRCAPVYEVPKGTGRNALYAASLWIGGMVGGELRMSAATYSGWEMWPGLLDAEGNPPSDPSPYDRVYSVYDEDIRTYNETSVATPDMLDWPWNLGAPVFDGDGFPDNYDLPGGDRPGVYGDQTLWWVMNDRGGEHRTTGTAPIGLEVHVTAFAGRRPEGLWAAATTFYRYELIYRGSEPLEDAYVGLYADPDLGYSGDDYIGCDTVAGLGFVYNADDFDEGEKGYGSRPPALGFSFVRGPVVDADGRDNNRDGEIDEPGELLRMTAFGWLDPQSLIWDGRGRQSPYWDMLTGQYPVYCPPTARCDGPSEYPFMYPARPPAYWSEENIDGGGTRRAPGDRRFVMASGPFRMEPGDTQEIILAIIYSKGTDRYDAVYRLTGAPASLRNALPYLMAFDTTAFVPRPPPIEIPPPVTYGLGHFPNPASDAVEFRLELPEASAVRLVLYDLLGRQIDVLADGRQEAARVTVDYSVGDLPAGLYLYRLETPRFVAGRPLTIVR